MSGFERFERPSVRRRPHPRPKATRDAEIRRAFVAGVSRHELAASYELSHPRICQIVNDLPGDLAAQSAMGAAYRGDPAGVRTALARMSPEQLRELVAAAAVLADAASKKLEIRA